MAIRQPGRGRFPRRRSAAEQHASSPSAWGYDIPESESAIQRDIQRALERIGFKVTVYSEPRKTHLERGHPDMRARHGAWGMRFWIETKSADGKLRPEQLEWHNTERDCGGIVLIVRSVGDAMRQVAELRRAA